ncbi:HVO_0234 family beta-propeller protein [Halorussus amylolyticus]|uniref:HVO_0234 family beta-propeller protein n=1 Tax=Halorussus amylolyticus TaxID=1126242 RepID=UPI001042FB64|nr:hypothetical protein [Halorussus amylolyticus]
MGISIDEKRVYAGDDDTAPVYVVGEFGIAVVETSDDLVGGFELERQCDARDAAGADGRVAVATDEDVLVGGRDGFEPLGVGPAVAVGFAGSDLLVATEDGRILRSGGGDGDADANDSWTEIGELPDVRAIDGDFLATASGVYRATGDSESASASLEHVGLEDVRDVSAAGVPLAATGDGLYRLGNGWLDELDGGFRAVSAARRGADRADWAHAARESASESVSDSAGESGLYAREDGEWRAVEIPTESEIVALAHGEGAYAVTEDGTFLLSVGDGWRSQLLGLPGVRALAAP